MAAQLPPAQLPPADITRRIQDGYQDFYIQILVQVCNWIYIRMTQHFI